MACSPFDRDEKLQPAYLELLTPEALGGRGVVKFFCFELLLLNRLSKALVQLFLVC